jgi:hypothetical protein
VPETSPKSKRRWLGWLLRLSAAGVLLLAVAAVFHEALLRALLRHGGPVGAEMAGVRLTWEVEGSVMRDLKLTNITASGLMIEKAAVGEFSAAYDARAALTDVVKRIALRNVEAVVDLRKLPKSETVQEKPVEASKEPPPLVWPEVIDIENANASVTLADGKVLTIRGLTLRIGEGMPGVFECAEFKMEPGDLRVAGVKAAVEWKKRELTIRGLDLPYGAKLGALTVDLREWEKDAASVKVEAGLGNASVMVEALATGIFGGALQTKADVKVANFTSQDWKMPEGLVFGPVNAEVHAEGDPTMPMKLRVDGKVDVTDVRAAGAILDRVSAVFGVKDGVAQVSEAKVLRGVNEVVASMEAKLAEDVMKSPWKAALKAKMADVTQLLVKPPPVKGVVEISASAEGVGATPVKAEAQVDGSELGFERYQLPKLAVDVAMDGKEAKVTVPALMVGDGNQIDLKAAMRMEDDMPVTAEWKVAVDDPMLLMKTLNLPPLEQPVTAKLSTTGKAALRVNDLMNAEAEMMLSVKDGRFGEAPLPVVELKAAVTKGEAVVESCRVIVDARNRVELKGTAGLKEPWRFGVDGVVEMPELKALNTLLAAFKAPVIESGALNAKLDVSGDAKPWRGEGNVTLEAKAVKVAGMPEAADVALETAFEGTTATMESLQAVLGPWKLMTKGVVNEVSADLSELSLHQKDRQLLSGHAKAAFDLSALDVVLNAKDLPVHEVAVAAGVKDVPPAILNTEIAVRGLEDAEVKLNVKDVKAPGLPKGFSPAAVDVLTVLKGGKLVVDAKVDQKPLQPLLMKAEAPVVIRDLMAKPALAADLPIKATLDLADSDLSFVRDFAPELLRSVPAKMRLNAKVGGTVKAPLVDSALNVDVPEVVFASADLPSVREVKVRVRTHDRTVRLEEVSALLAGGRVKLGGSVDVAKPDDPRFDLKLEAREALVFRNPTSSLRANADIVCSGGLKAAKVSGVVEAVRGRIFQEVNLLPNVMGVIKQGEKLPPPPASTAKSAQKVELPPLLKDWSFDLKVRTRDPVLLAGNLVNGAISADVKLGGTGAKPLLTGFANVDRLLIKLPFSLLKITKGVVTMNSENPFAPKLDVRGESRVGSTDISLYVYGEATNPKTRFTSSPPMSEADIVTMLGTGMTLGGDNAQMASEAMTRAAFLVVSETWRKLFNSEKKVSDEPPKLHMTFNPSGGDRANDSMQAMYELTPKVRFTGRFMQSGRMKALLGYVLRFGKAARAMEEEVAR